MYTIYDIMLELGTWIKFFPSKLAKAKVSKITTSNNREFKRLVSDWENGMYDEDIDQLGREISNLLD